MERITDIRVGQKNKERIHIYIGGKFAFAVYADTAVSHRLKTGAYITEEEKERILQEDGEKYALSCAMKLLSYRMRTEKELRDKLREKEIAEETVGRVIRKLEEIGYLDDGRFAELYAQELSRKYGRYVVIQKLMQKGIPRDIARAAAQSTEKDEDVIRGHIGRLTQKYRAENEKSAKQKIMRALLAKGFEYEEIKRALERHEEE